MDPVYLHNGDDDDPADQLSHMPMEQTREIISGPNALVNAQIYLPDGDRNKVARVLGRKRDSESLFIGRKQSNPLSWIHGFLSLISQMANKRILHTTFLQNIYTPKLILQANNNDILLPSSIIAKQPGHLTKKTNIVSRMGNKSKRKTTTGWHLEVQWRDGSNSWLPLKEVKKLTLSKFILVYMDDILCISEDPLQIINTFAEPPFLYRLKDVGPPLDTLELRL